MRPRYDDGIYATSKNNLWCAVGSDNYNYIIDYLNSKLMYFFTQKQCKYSGFNNIGIMKMIPKLDFTKQWTDQELYQYFNLTQDEIDLIENN